ncbi:MAG: B12-binding domain-containing radical SAM protein [Desulfuromonas sp.]|nr:MAG: B12-binding domain-containing radical SAM protein [Desulfuromonas sp.]
MRTLLTTLHSKYIHPSLALPYLAAYCGDCCGDILIREYTIHEPKENVLGRMLRLQPDVIAFSVYLWNRTQTLELVELLLTVRPELKIVLGGPEISFETAQFFQRYPVSALICGEGEIPLRKVLLAWSRGQTPVPSAGVLLPGSSPGPHTVAQLEVLDDIPSPFAEQLVDLSRGFVYYESSRGCPYRCSFCMSALDDGVRSFSMERIKADLSLLMERRVAKIKFVDRTFNYDSRRSLEIFRFILEKNRGSHFHFEIGAHLLDDGILDLLATVPQGMFQFEIWVQSMVTETLLQVDRAVSLEKLTANVRRLRAAGNIHVHLDLIAGLPGEGYRQFLSSLDKVAALSPHHLQIEPVKILPGAPLRDQARSLNLRFDPNPPYTVVETADLTFEQLETLRNIGRLMDLLWNSERFTYFLAELSRVIGSLSEALEALQAFWAARDCFAAPMSLRGVFTVLHDYVQTLPGEPCAVLGDALARDFARSERVVPNSAPGFFNTDLTEAEKRAVRDRVRVEVQAARTTGGKLQHFAAVFHHLPEMSGRTVVLFLYLTRSACPLEIEEITLTP